MVDKNKQKIYKNIIIVLILFSIVAIIFGSLIKFKESKKNNTNEDYIYDDITPIINVNSDVADEANETIKDLYNQAQDNETMYLNSQIYKNKNIYSLVIKNDNYSFEEESFLTSYIVYNLDINNNKLLENEDLLNKYGYNRDDVIKSAQSLLNIYYIDEVSQGYVEGNECDLDCYIYFVRGINDIYENIKLFVENDTLKGYITFSTNSLLLDQEYFENNNNDKLYQFDIVH